MEDKFINNGDGYLIIKSELKHPEQIVHENLNYKLIGFEEDPETNGYKHLYFSLEKFYIEKYNNLTVEHQVLQIGYNKLNERISCLETVCYSLVAMALERPEKINYVDLTNFFNYEE